MYRYLHTHVRNNSVSKSTSYSYSHTIEVDEISVYMVQYYEVIKDTCDVKSSNYQSEFLEIVKCSLHVLCIVDVLLQVELYMYIGTFI